MIALTVALCSLVISIVSLAIARSVSHRNDALAAKLVEIDKALGDLEREPQRDPTDVETFDS